jgi:hypothetical protein
MEISPLGLRCHYIEPGYFRTSFLTESNRAPYIPRIEDYAEMGKNANEKLVAYNGKQPGDPQKLVEIVVDIAQGVGIAKGKRVPRGLPLGSDIYRVIQEVSSNNLLMLAAWKAVITSTDFPEHQPQTIFD